MVFETDAENPDNNVWNVHGINLVSKKIGGEMFYCMYNGHADITAMISENGETAEKYYYDEWGKETETSKYGDITGDGKVTVSDYSLLKKHLYIEPLKLTSEQKKAADLNADGKVDTSDLNTLKQILFGEKKYCEADTNRDGFINEKNSIKYAGYYYDAETGLYYLNARFYDPETARFIQQDSYSGNIYDPLSLNLYTYSNNNPISYYDPTGHFVNSLIKTFKNVTKSVVDTTKEAVTYFTDKTTEVATALVNKTKEIARDTAQKTQEFISHPVQTTSRAAKEFSENWHSGIDQLKQSGTTGQMFGAYSEGVVNNLTNTASGFVQFIKDPLGTVNETVDYFLQDPLINNPVTALGMYYYDVGKASYAHDWNTVANKVGSGTVTVAEVLGTEYVLKGINGLKKNPAAKNPAGKSSVANGVKGSTTASASGIRNQSRYSLTGAEHYEDLKHVFGADNVKWERSALHYSRPVDEAHNVVNYVKYKKVLQTTELANDLMDSLKSTGKLPANYIKKADAITNGWSPNRALGNYISGAQLGGDEFYNRSGILPQVQGRTWFEADVGLTNTISRAKQPGTRLVYSNDGLAYVTYDHYLSAHFIGKWK